jgi:hypothetical protein
MTETDNMKWVPLDAIRVWRNARTTFDQGALRELANSLADSGGVLHYPVGWAVADDPGTEVELLLGERRLRAYRMLRDEGRAGFERLPVRLVERPSEAVARKWSLVENVQREELRPSEAGVWLAEMLEMTGDSGRPVWSVESLAEEIGKPRLWVLQAMALGRCEAAVRAAVDEGRCSLEVGAAVGGLPAELREGAAAEMVLGPMGAMSAAQARDWLRANYRRDLRRAVFEVEKAGLAGRPACLRCEWWGGNRDDVGGRHRESVCLNPGCFAAKQGAEVAARAAAEGGSVSVSGERPELWEGHSGRLAPDAGYVELSERPPAGWLEVGEGAMLPTWREMLRDEGVAVEVVLDGQGEPRELVAVGEALRAAAGSRWGSLFRAAALAEWMSPEERASVRAARAAGEREGLRALGEALAELQGGWWESARSGEGLAEVLRAALEVVATTGLKREDVGLLASAVGAEPGTTEGLLAWSRGTEVSARELAAALAAALAVRRVRYEGLELLEEGGALCALGQVCGRNVREWVRRVRKRRAGAEAAARDGGAEGGGR